MKIQFEMNIEISAEEVTNMNRDMLNLCVEFVKMANEMKKKNNQHQNNNHPNRSDERRNHNK